MAGAGCMVLISVGAEAGGPRRDGSLWCLHYSCGQYCTAASTPLLYLAVWSAHIEAMSVAPLKIINILEIARSYSTRTTIEYVLLCYAIYGVIGIMYETR